VVDSTTNNAGHIRPIGIVDQMQTAYLDYSMSVIVSRALPDVRDGLKPVHRRVLYAMERMGLQSNRSFRKCAGIVGEVLKDFHPHGDASVYDALVRMAQPWNMRYPLVAGQGNFGCFTGDTRITLLDGTEKSFAELAQLPPDEVFYVYSVNRDGRIVVGAGRHARQTRTNAELVAVTLDNGATLRCTPNHPFMLRDGTYKDAEYLTANDALMPFDADVGEMTVRIVARRGSCSEPGGLTPVGAGAADLALGGRIATLVAAPHVVSVRRLTERADVYDITVNEHHNFLLADGVFVHNSPDDDPAAAMRYTEAKMSAIAAELLADIEKDTVDFRPNYDGHEMEPTVLPARLPQLLLNGAAGIAVGMATNIPPHNLRELCDGITHLIEYPDASVEDLLRFVKGPDFPTGGIIHGRSGIRSAAMTGRGRIVVRARANTEESDRGRVSIVVTELPYQVNKAELVKKIAELARDKKIEGISDVRDESDRQGTRVVIDLKKDTRHLTVLNQLFKYTAMQTAFNANMLALVDGQPRVLNIKAILQHYITYRESVIKRRTSFDLRKARERAHILEGLQIALDHLDEVIETIRRSQSTDTAARNLRERFKLSEEQARAILDMRLGRLAALERKKITEELTEVRKTIAHLEGILADVGEVRKLIKADLVELREKYGDPRRTEIQEDEAGEFTEEDLIPNDEMIVSLTEQNYIKRLPSKTYRAQRRGGKGVTGMTTREDDTVLHLLITHAHDALLFFTNRGRVFQLATYELPEVGRQAKGEHIRNLIGIETSERVTAIVAVPKFQALDYLIMATRLGEIKKTSLDEFAVVRRMGLIAMDLEEGDELIGARLVHTSDTVFLVTTHGQSIRFAVSDLRSASRTSGGVRGIRLEDGDSLVTLDVAQKGGQLLVVTAHGYGKRTPVEEYTTQGRGGSGILTARLTDKTGLIAGARVLTEVDRDLVLISSNGVVIRSPISTIAQLSRATQGVRLMNLAESDSVSALATTIDEEDDEAIEDALETESPDGATGK
jgi:DNA gyrase subunit A